MTSNTQQSQVVILGAGHAGSSVALMLAEQGVPSILVEKDEEISQGPACHLHAFGAMYPDMQDTTKLAEMAISFGLSFPECLELRPSVIGLSATAPYTPTQWHARLQRSGRGFRKLLDKLTPEQRSIFIPEGAPVVEVLRSSVHKDLPAPSRWAKQSLPWLPDATQDAVLAWEVGINDIRLAALFELAVQKNPLIDVRLSTTASNVEKSGNDWSVTLNKGAEAHTIKARAVVDARGWSGQVDKTAEFKAVFRAEHQAPAQNQPEVIILDKRGAPGSTQYTPAHFGSKLHKMELGASLFDCVLENPGNQDLQKMNKIAQDPSRCLTAYNLAAPALTKGTLPSLSSIKPLPLAARFQRLPKKGGAEARSSHAKMIEPGYVDVLLSKTTSAVTIARKVVEQLGPYLPRNVRSQPLPQRISSAQDLTDSAVLERSQAVAVRRGFPSGAAYKYAWTELSASSPEPLQSRL